MRKKINRFLIVFSLIIIYIYVFAIEVIEETYVIFEGENLPVNTIIGLNLQSENETIETSANTGKKVINDVGTTTLQVSLFNNFLVKEVKVDVLPKTTVIPVGNIAGVKLYTSGVLVVGMSEIEGYDNKKYKPYEKSGIKEGDRIVEIDNAKISSTADLIEKVNDCNGESINVKYIQENETKECSIIPAKTYNSEYKLGLWVRDSAAGVGTVTFYEPSTKSFAALGHGITDIDTAELINISSGEFVTTKVLNITKGESGNPGKIQGTVEEQRNIGSISKNTKFGIFGTVDNVSNLNVDSSKEMEVALREEIKTGKAKILCNLDGRKVEEYEIEIEKVYTENNYNNKSMQIKITDQRLLDKTGGIIQGMSGSPIIQNGKFVGAVTHVLVSNPTMGYGVFADLMIKEMRKQ